MKKKKRKRKIKRRGIALTVDFSPSAFFASTTPHCADLRFQPPLTSVSPWNPNAAQHTSPSFFKFHRQTILPLKTPSPPQNSPHHGIIVRFLHTPSSATSKMSLPFTTSDLQTQPSPTNLPPRPTFNHRTNLFPTDQPQISTLFPKSPTPISRFGTT